VARPVSRPALSAARSSEIIDFLALFPERGFTLSEIVRATKINVASCHAVLTTLTDCGYLTRSPKERIYTLGRALIAIGQVALNSQPLVARAKEAAEILQRELGTAVLLTTVVADEILALVSLPNASGRTPGMRVAERMPLVAPVGAPFLAWASDEVIRAWIARHAGPRGNKSAAVWRQAVALTRKRGYQVTLRSPNSPEIATLMAEMASGGRVPDYKEEVLRLVNSFDRELSQPESIVAEDLYDILLISAPIFDQNGEATFNLSLIGFSAKLTGAAIMRYADQLVRVCLDVMRADRERQSSPAAKRQASHSVPVGPSTN
jgi:DNA-binding IclR family transcriptional regulator